MLKATLMIGIASALAGVVFVFLNEMRDPGERWSPFHRSLFAAFLILAVLIVIAALTDPAGAVP